MNRVLQKTEIILAIAALLAIIGVGISIVHSFDVFWQLQSGRYMVETGAVIRNDVFTLTSELGRNEHCWLHDILLYGVYLIGGYGAISVWKGLMIGATALVLFLTARTRTSSITAILACSPLLLLTAGGWLERPQLWTFLLFAGFLYLLEKHLITRSVAVYGLIPLMIFWANAHGGAVLGVAVLGAYLVSDIASNLLYKRRLNIRSWKTLLFAGVLTVLSGGLTPNLKSFFHTLMAAPGLGTQTSATGQVTGPITQVFNMDWTGTTFATEPLFYYMMAVAAILLLISFKRIVLSDLFLLIGMSIMGLSLVRHIPFFYFCCLAILPRYLDNLGELVGKLLKPSWRAIAQGVCLIGICYCFWIFYQPLYRTYGLLNTGLRTWHYPIAATEFVKEHQLKANIYNTYDWGGYMAWELFPDYKMFWDGRQISAEMFKLGWQVMAGRENWVEILDKFEVNTIVSRASTIDTGQEYPLLERLRISNDWHLVFNTESSMIFVRSGSVSEEWLNRYRRPKENIDDTILSEAHLMVSVNPNRYMAWWEMTEVYVKRQQYNYALSALKQHLARAPRPHPQAQKLYQQLSAKLGKK